jgi:hypothetical protein
MGFSSRIGNYGKEGLNMDAISTAINYVKPAMSYVQPVLSAASQLAPIAGMFMGGGGGNNTSTTVTTPNMQYPSASYLAGKKSQGTANAGQNRNNAYESMARNLSIRGIGPNSPYSAGKASGIEGSYLDSLTGLQNKLLDLENTPTNMGSTTVSSTPKTSNPLAMALGMMMYGNGRNNSGATKAQDPYGDAFDYMGLYNMNNRG